MTALPLTLLLLLAACSEPDSDDSGTTTDGGAESDGGSQSDGGSSADGGSEPEEDHPVGQPVPAFALEDINPTSATFGQVISSDDLAGSPYALIFLDSRCKPCGDVADDMWAQLQDHPQWMKGLPTFGVQSYAAVDTAPDSIERIVDGNSLPYLADTEETWLWGGLEALNHDFFAVSAEGTLDTWLPLYTWPEDLVVYTDYMTDRFGE